ncbi:MAG: MFS transporter, partial [Pseudomonadota bacterium]
MDAKADAQLERPPDPRRWVTLLILFTARFALGVQFQSAGSVTPFVLEEFGSGYAGLGTLVGLYLLPGILLTIPLGFMGQRFGDRLIVLLGLGLMVVGGLLSSMASDYTTLAAGRVIAGIGSIALFVLLTKMLADWFTGRELYFGMSLF